MSRTAHFLHGFNVSDGGEGTTDKLIPVFRAAGFRAIAHDYGWFGLVRVRLCNGGVAEAVKATVKRGDIGIGHSNGCAILAEAADRGAPFAGMVLINPALDEDRILPQSVRWIHVYYNSGDTAVWASRLLQFSHPWGAMGRLGFKGDDPRYRNIDCGPDVNGHSDIFTKLDKWGSVMVQNVVRELKPKAVPKARRA
jgi:pimeloyl-ACP methyl ester carboxylesterase